MIEKIKEGFGEQRKSLRKSENSGRKRNILEKKQKKIIEGLK